jgi:hypothetical protein
MWNGHELARATRVDVQAARYVPLDVSVQFHPNGDAPPEVEKAIEAAVRSTFDTAKKDLPLVRVSGRDAFSEPSLPGLLGWADYRVGEAALRDRVTTLPSGSSVVVGRVDVTIVRPSP